MQLWIQLLGGGGLVALVTAVGTWYVARGSNKNKAEEIAAEKARTQLAGNIELNKYIDERIEKALAVPQKQIDTLREDVRKLTERERTTKSILRRWFQRLVWWDERNRPGPMPMPPETDMHLLDLSDIELTSPPDRVEFLRAEIVSSPTESKE